MPCLRLSLPRILTIPIFLALVTQQATATPLQPEDEVILELQNSTIQARGGGCAIPCGYNGWLCCQAGQYCYTDAATQAQCGNGASITAAPTASWGAGAGHWQYWTSTWVQTDLVTITSVYSSWCPSSTAPPVAASTTAAPVTCDWASGESSCGNICCTSSQYCAVEGQCAAAGSWTSSYSPALRPTSAGVAVATITTTTQPFIAAIPTAQAAQETGSSLSVMGSSSSSLSGGAIAGIVIGVILGIFFLIIICLFLCFRGAWHALLAIFGLGPRRRRRREVVEEYHRHGSRSGGRTWYGNQPSRIEKKKSSGLGWGGVLAGLGGLAVALGIKRRADRKRDEKSEYTASSYDYSSSYDSSSSSDRRTRDTRRSRR